MLDCVVGKIYRSTKLGYFFREVGETELKVRNRVQT